MSDKFQVLVRDVMAKPIAIAKSAFVSEALEKMLDEGVDPLIVTNNGAVIGTTSRAAIAEALGSRKTQAMKATSIHVANTVEENFTSAYPDQNIDILVPHFLKDFNARENRVKKLAPEFEEVISYHESGGLIGPPPFFIPPEVMAEMVKEAQSPVAGSKEPVRFDPPVTPPGYDDLEGQWENEGGHI